ncbi:uncharacterized protein AB675_4327 [Cyphellophora attinorum]|uniref:Uncharacterized protein n=1 Tax=Cyphellophora attinorum TaxID=1664694 RepID=A0A0N1HJD9_9EURO|nr:uncharacterized protein AB675_4327 [Phialophora attinorum]KPI36543.1 hypothetical protein AB675_4327 [Phialophora attinorum]
MSLFKARAKPKRIGREVSDSGHTGDDDDNGSPAVRRPGAAKQKSKLRVAFDPTASDANDSSSAVPSDIDVPSVVRPLKRNAPTSLQDRLKQTSIREDESAPSRPSYSKSALDELRASTPSTPKDHLSLTTTPDPASDSLALSAESKFGKLPASTSTAIPSATEIAERKARRARLALEQSALPASTTDPDSEDYIPLDAYDSDGEFKPSRMQVGTWHQPAKEKDTRLVHEDEDIAEGFEEFTEPSGPIIGEGFLGGSSISRNSKTSRSDTKKERNRLTTDSLNLTSRSAKLNAAAHRDAIRAAIDAAEGNDHASSNASSDDNSASEISDDDSSGDETARHHLFEQSQTSHALPSALSGAYMKQAKRPKQPPVTSPIPKINAALGGLRERVEAIRLEKAALQRRKEALVQEREGIRGRLEYIQNGLEESGRELEGVLRSANGDGGQRVMRLLLLLLVMA